MNGGDATVKETEKGLRPDSLKEEAMFHELHGIYQKLIKANRKQYALQKQKDSYLSALVQIPRGMLHRRDRKDLQERIDGLDRQIETVRSQMSMIPKQNGFENVTTVKMAYRSTKNALEEVRRKQAEWDGVELSVELKTKTQRQKVSVLKELAEKRAEVSERQTGHKRNKMREL